MNLGWEADSCMKWKSFTHNKSRYSNKMFEFFKYFKKDSKISKENMLQRKYTDER